MVRFSRREGLKLMLLSAYPGSIAAAGAALAAVTYDSLVNIFDPDVVSYWKFQNDGDDERHTQDPQFTAQFTGSPELNVETIVDLDTIADGAPADGECIAWPGTNGIFAEAPHHAAHKTPEGTIVVTFQQDARTTPRATLVAADANGTAGGLSFAIEPDGAPRSFLQPSVGSPVILLGQAGDVQLNEAYTLIFKWGSTGLSMALWNEDGDLVRRETNALADGVTGTSPIRSGAWHDGTGPFDGPFGRMIWLNRRISDAEEAILARAKTVSRGPVGEGLTLLGAWPLAETSGPTFADSEGSNDASLTVPSWTVATHEHNRPGIVAGSDHALEVSNGGPSIPMSGSYKQSAMSLVIYAEPRGELRGTQYWDTTELQWGREFIAYCDDGSTPGSFAIERRRLDRTFPLSITGEWRLDGYVRNGAGVAQRFSGGVNGIAGALLPIDTAKRIVLAQGPTGAHLYLDGSLVASLPTVTQGWSSLTTPITLGSSSSSGHANDRSPFWGRLDQIEIWQGQMGLADVQALPSARQSLLYRIPTDGPLVNITAHGGNIQNAVNAAAAVNGYVYQDAGDTTVYMQPAGNDIDWSTNCRGMVGMRVKKGDGEELLNGFVIQVSTAGCPYESYKFIGCDIDGNGRGQDWHPHGGEGGFSHTAFDLQQSHAIRIESTQSGADLPVLVDACAFHDGTGDAVSLYNRAKTTVRSCRFYGYFRGPIVVNSDGETELDARRCESFSESRKRTGVYNGCGLMDIEPFGGGVDALRSVRVRIADMWAESDFDDNSRQMNDSFKSWSRYYNVHTMGAAFSMSYYSSATSPSFQARPISEVTAQRCTISFWRKSHGGGNFPASEFHSLGPGDAGLGAYFEDSVFIANGVPYAFHEDSLLDPATDGSPATAINCFRNNTNNSHQPGRQVTLKNCQVRAFQLPGGLSQSNTRFFVASGGFTTSFVVEFDSLTIDGAFANTPIVLDGMTIRHRNVLHERTGSTTPWSGAGAIVAI